MKQQIHSLLFLLFVLMLFSSPNNSFGQASIVFGTTSDAFMVMGNTFASIGEGATTKIYLVIGDNSVASMATTSIKRTTNGGIISNSENNIVRWYMGSGTGAYIVPWYFNSTSYIPLTLNKVSGVAAQNGKFLDLATYRTTTSNNGAYAPLGVTNFYSPSCACDPSLWMVDRFWLIDNSNFSAGSLPDVQLTFTYVDGGSNAPEVFTGSGAGTQNANLTAAGEANLEAESYNGPANKWTGVTYGSDNAGANTVGPTVTIPNTKLYQWWAIVDKAKPLPVTWLDLAAECESGNMIIKWSTASEQNADFFTIEKSLDGTNFEIVSTIKASGNSSTTKNYSLVDHDAYSGTSFYRIKETDFNGDFSYSSMITVTSCNSDNINIFGTDGGATININALEDGQYNIDMYDLLGKKIVNETKNVVAGSNHIKLAPNDVASAIYVVKVYNSSNAVAKKVFIRSSNIQ